MGFSHFVDDLFLFPEILFDRANSVVHNRGQYWIRIKNFKYQDFPFEVMEFMKFAGVTLLESADEFRNSINSACVGLEPWQIISYTIGVLSVILYIQYFLHGDEPLSRRLAKRLFKLVRKLPIVNRRIQKEVAKAREDIEHSIHSSDLKKEFFKYLPDEGIPDSEILKLSDEYSTMGNVDFNEGTISGAVYGGDAKVTDLVTKVFGKFTWSNPLHPDIFPGIRKMEAEMTTGGTESILLAVLAYRNRALDKGINDPEIVMPITAHAAFDKAAHMYRMRVKHVRLDPKTLAVDIKAMKRAITSNTCMLVGSAPQFPHGTIDPIEDIAKLGEKYNIPVHVDACLGGFLIPFMELAGYPTSTMFDFRLPGVQSISADSHKYGYAPKGTSVIMYREQDNLHYQYFSQPNWPGGIYATPTLGGSRCGANIATCWATMLHFGKDSYIEMTREIIEATELIKEGIERHIPELHILGRPEVSVVAFNSSKFNIYNLADKMASKGWHLNNLQYPGGIHIAVTPHHCQAGVLDRFLGDLSEISKGLVKNPPKGKDAEGAAAIYGTTQAIPDRSLVTELAYTFLDCCLSTEPPLPADEEAMGESGSGGVSARDKARLNSESDTTSVRRGSVSARTMSLSNRESRKFSGRMHTSKLD